MPCNQNNVGKYVNWIKPDSSLINWTFYTYEMIQNDIIISPLSEIVIFYRFSVASSFSILKAKT